jgi:predicted transcriptional regulator
MSAKELVLATVQNLPDDATLRQISERIAILAALQEGMDDIEAGRVISQEEVERKLESWLSK